MNGEFRMKDKISKRIVASMMSITMLTAVVPCDVWAANVEETPGIQLSTILVDNNGNDWKTESWGGACLTPNTNWTNLTIEDYYDNGTLTFEVRSTDGSASNFNIGLQSKRHGKETAIRWNKEIAGVDFKADGEWKSFELSIKELVDAYPDSEFRLDSLWYICVGGVSSGVTLEFRNMKIASTDDERQNPIIKVNQVGYHTDSEKVARVSYFAKFGSLNEKSYEIVDAGTEKVVLKGTLSKAEENDGFSGESVHVIDFSELTEEGTYFIRIPDANLDESARSPQDVRNGLELDTITSYQFTVGDDVYEGLLNDLTKYYYYQRQGIDLEEKYAGVFARENLHPDDAKVVRWSDRDVANAETFDISQGWYDAGDYGKYVAPACGTLSDLLLAYDLFPEVFDRMDLNIPETDTKNDRYVDAPGFLSEVKWELDMLRKLEHKSKDGSFYIAANYADGTIYIEDTLKRSSTSDAESDLRSHHATAGAAAVFAHAYLIYKDVPAYAEFAEECLATSLRAWKWVNDPANKKNYSIDAANRTYSFDDETLDRTMFWAAGVLYRAMKEQGKDVSAYEKFLLDNVDKECNTNCFLPYMSLQYNHSAQSFLGFFHYLYENPDADETLTKVFSKFESWRKTRLGDGSWGLAYPDWGYWWGSNQGIAQNAMTLYMGSLIVDGKDAIPANVLTAMQNTSNYLLGVNPLSFCYVSGEGENSVENIYSGIYSNAKRLDPYQCPDGYFTEGCNNYDNANLSKFVGKCYIDSDVEYTTNENTIYGNAAMTFLTAAMMHQNAGNSDKTVKGDVNKDGTFSIADIILMQKWLLDIPKTTLANPEAGEFTGDDTLNVFDLSAMKREFFK